MCGIVGIVKHGQAPDLGLLEKMSSRIKHRGPDDQGSWSENNVALAHRRLSIVDLSRAGKQPMSSHDEAWVISYNGEIYNFEALKNELNGSWSSASDTEVLDQTQIYTLIGTGI